MELKIARAMAKLTQRELAERAGLDDSAISNVETGKRDIRSMSYESVFRIAYALGVRSADVPKLWPVAPLTLNPPPPELGLPSSDGDGEARDV